MKKYILPIIVFTAVLIYFIYCIYLYGISNISIYNIILFLFASPLLEEFIFRGLVQNSINKFFKSGIFLHISYGSFISSLIFTFFHLLLNDFVFMYILVFLPSLFFGYLYDKYKTLLLPVLFHSFFNINAFISYPLNDLTIFFVEKL